MGKGSKTGSAADHANSADPDSGKTRLDDPVIHDFSSFGPGSEPDPANQKPETDSVETDSVDGALTQSEQDFLDAVDSSDKPETGNQTPETGNQKPETRLVRILVENLGPKLYKRGMVTDDPEIVRLLDTERGRRLVREAI